MKDTDPIAVLLIEDHPGDARLVEEALADSRTLRFTLTHVPTLAAGIADLRRERADVVLLDLSLPDGEGLASLARLHQVAVRTPVLVLTGTEDEELALEAVRGGAQDYFVKGIDPGALARGIAHAVERQRMLLELEATRREQLALKDRVLAHVAHELRTPLHAIGGFLTLLGDGLAGELSAAQREYVELAQQNAQQLGRMIADLVDATRAESGKLVVEPALLDLATLVDETARALRPLAEAKAITLDAGVPARLSAYADPQRVRQVLTSLVDNALKFTPPGGRVRVLAEATETDEVARVSVVDTGCGVAPEVMDRIFERLYQADGTAAQRGLGLGLYISRALVERQGGSIWVEPAPERGTVFRFTLPRRAPRVDAVRPVQAAAAPAPS